MLVENPPELDEVIQTSDLIILHTLDGDLWDASDSASTLLGYTNEEIKQLCLSNIKANILRLSDVRKSGLERNVTIFERRDGSRFAAEVDTSIIKSTLMRETIDLVQLVLKPVILQTDQTTEVESFDANELNGLFQIIENDAIEAAKNVDQITELLAGTLKSERQKKMLDALMNLYTEERQILNQTIESCKLSTNIKKIDNQPFNIYETIENCIQKMTSEEIIVSASFDSNTAEILYGDSEGIETIISEICEGSKKYLRPNSIGVTVSSYNSKDKDSELRITLQLNLLNDDKVSNSNDKRIKQLSDSTNVFIARSLLSKMNGDLVIKETRDNAVIITARIEIDEVNDLGVRNQRRFMEGYDVAVLDTINSEVRNQILFWGGNLVEFDCMIPVEEIDVTNIPKLVFYVGNQNEGHHADRLNLLSKYSTVIAITPVTEGIELSQDILNFPLPYKTSEIGNKLSQILHSVPPYPYCVANNLRIESSLDYKGEILIIMHEEEERNYLSEELKNNDYSVDIAVNGIDAVLACTNWEYKVIIVDEELPQMDAFETIGHLRKNYQNSSNTPVILLTSKLTENSQIAMKAVDIDLVLQRPFHIKEMIAMINRNDNSYGSSVRDTNDLSKARRRAESNRNEKGQNFNALDISILERFINDTSLDVFQEVLHMFITECIEDIGRLDLAYRGNDLNTCLVHCKGILASAATFGLKDLQVIGSKLIKSIESCSSTDIEPAFRNFTNIYLVSQIQILEYSAKKQLELS